MLPWAERTGWVLCDVYFTNGRPVPFSGRRILKEALAPLESDSCGGCYHTLTTNDIARVQMSLLIRCPNCNAFLYLPEDNRIT